MNIFLIVLVILCIKIDKGVLTHPKEAKGISENKRVERLDITKSPNDRRLYRGLKLGNKMKVTLISDPSTVKSAAALVVGVGALNDFRGVPGLTNLLGHLLLMSCKRYPRLHDFDRFLHEHGGRVNSLTLTSEQAFIFEVDPDHFLPALYRFAQYFVEPSLVNELNQEALLDALQDVEWDYCDRAKTDTWRISEIENSISKNNHPFNHLYTGNMKLLYENLTVEPVSGKSKNRDPKLVELQDKLQKLHSMWYSSNIMTVAILGKESLNKLEQYVVPLFEKIENKNVTRLTYSFKHHPWGPEQLKHKIYIVPKDDSRLIHLNFPVPDYLDRYRIAPAGYIGNFLEEKGPGSLISLLKKRDLCGPLQARYTLSSGIGFYRIACNLTNKGLQHVDDIIGLIFEYISLLKTKGVEKRIFDEYRMMNKIDFLSERYNLPPSNFVKYLSSNMQDYPMEVIVTGNFLQDYWDPFIIKSFLCYFTPDNVNITIVDKSFEKRADRLEERFGTKYSVEKIPEELLQNWELAEASPELQLPPPNNFIPENLDVFPVINAKAEFPEVIHESSKSQIWFKQDNEFRIPILHLRLDVMSLRMRLDPFTRVLTSIFIFLINTSLKESMYSATVASFNWEIILTERGFSINVHGYNDKFAIFFDKFVSKIIDFKTQLQRMDFEKAKKNYMSQFVHLNIHQQLAQGSWFHDVLMSEYSWTQKILLNAANLLQYDDMKKYLTHIFSRVFFVGFIYGNCYKKKAMEIANILERNFKSCNGLLPQEIDAFIRQPEIPERSHLVYETSDRKLKFNFYHAYFQFNSETSPRIDVLGFLLLQIIIVPCQQLLKDHDHGKLSQIMCALLDRRGVRGLLILVESGHPPTYIDAKVEKFINTTVPGKLKNLSAIDFERNKQKLKEEKYTTWSLDRLCKLYWNEISNRHYIFRRRKLWVEYLDSAKPQDVLDFFMTIRIRDPLAFKSMMILLPSAPSPG